MSYQDLYVELIAGLLAGSITREEAAGRTAAEVPIDKVYEGDALLLENCEWALRHANEPGYFTPMSEFEYNLSCLRQERAFSPDERDRYLNGRS